MQCGVDSVDKLQAKRSTKQLLRQETVEKTKKEDIFTAWRFSGKQGHQKLAENMMLSHRGSNQAKTPHRRHNNSIGS